MTYEQLGKSNAKVSKICLGTMHFGPKATEEESFRIMDTALEHGINFFDTADIYGGTGNWGRSEEIIGKWIAQDSSRRDQIVLATKVYGADRSAKPWPNVERGISDYKIRKQVAGSLRRLQTDHIDLYQVHHLDRTITTEEFWTSFERLQNSGEVIYMGTSNHPGWALASLQIAATQRGGLGLVSEQHMYNLFCRYPELEVLPAAKRFGVGILVYMPLSGGLLTGNRKPDAGSRTAAVAEEYGITLEGNTMLDDYEALCKEIGEEPRNVAIAWTLAHPAVTSAIVGVRTVEQLEGVIRAAEIELEPDVVKRLNDIFPVSQGRELRNNEETPEAYAW